MHKTKLKANQFSSTMYPMLILNSDLCLWFSYTEREKTCTSSKCPAWLRSPHILMSKMFHWLKIDPSQILINRIGFIHMLSSQHLTVKTKPVINPWTPMTSVRKNQNCKLFSSPSIILLVWWIYAEPRAQWVSTSFTMLQVSRGNGAHDTPTGHTATLNIQTFPH